MVMCGLGKVDQWTSYQKYWWRKCCYHSIKNRSKSSRARKTIKKVVIIHLMFNRSKLRLDFYSLFSYWQHNL